MNSKMMRNWTVLCYCALAALLITSCQKEITGAVAIGCKVQQWTSLNANGGLAYRFSYSYDSATGRATQLNYTDSLGVQTTVIPTYKGDTVFFSNGSYAVLDGSKRIKHLVEKSGFSASGDYYYEYDANGHLVKSTYDDGSTSQVYNATYTGDALTKLTVPVGTIPDAIAVNYTYSDSIKVLGYNYFMIVDNNFTELEPYLACFTIGTVTTKAVTKQEVTLAIQLPISFTPTITNFSNYVLTGQGYISSLNATSTGGYTASSSINVSYLCK